MNLIYFFPICFVGLHVRLSKTGRISRLHEFVSPVRYTYSNAACDLYSGKEKA